MSGGRRQRLERLAERVKATGARAIVIYHLDRFARDLAGTLDYVRSFARRGVELHAVGRGRVEADTASGFIVTAAEGVSGPALSPTTLIRRSREAAMSFTTTPLIVTLALALALLAAPVAAGAQQTEKIGRLGVLWPSSRVPEISPILDAFRQGMRELGYIEARNLRIEWRFAEGKDEKLPALAAELVRLNVDVIFTWGTPAAKAAQQSTRTIPVVSLSCCPVETGLVASLARPGGNITGLATLHTDLSPKRLELLRAVVPKLRRLAVLSNPANPAVVIDWRAIAAAARTSGLPVETVEARGADEFTGAFDAAVRKRANAIIVLHDLPVFSHRKRVVELAAKHRLPAMFAFREYVEAGGLMAYGPRLLDAFRRAAYYVDKILKGVKPADLPVEQPTKFELVINLKTAKALGLTIPPSVLLRADEVIQ